MRVFVVSDIHIDYQENKKWVSTLSSVDYTDDILILAGDVTDDLNLLGSCFLQLSNIFLKVLFVPGNHDLWISRDKSLNSIEKYRRICELAKENSISMQPFHSHSLSIVPLFGWYDFSFGSPCSKLMDTWNDFRNCDWPNDMQPLDINHYFLEKNEAHLRIVNQLVISFSHFLPRIDLMPFYIPQHYHYIYPALGSVLLEKQIRVLKPNIHVYGHSHVNRDVTLGGIHYINNAFGYPSEDRITNKNLRCIYTPA